MVFISVDMQYDFSRKGGPHYNPKRRSIAFVKNKLIPYLQKKNIKISEIISDYRPPRLKKSSKVNVCIPGEWGYTSEIPTYIRNGKQWIKCMNSPIWVRKNIGNAMKKPSYPYQDTKSFTKWLDETIGKPNEVGLVILFGLTTDCCVFCTCQELYFRGYNVRILKEATDTYTGHDKDRILTDFPLRNWMKNGPITFNELKRII